MTSSICTLTLLVKGGLGNQLFQFGAALEAATATGQSVALSMPAYALDRKRICHAATLFPEAIRLPAWREWLSAPLVMDRVARQTWLQELVLSDANAIEIGHSARVWRWASGYFQHVRFSGRVARRLDEHLRRAAPDVDPDCIAVHVRRTDFLQIPGLREEYVQLMRDYYRPAIERAVAEIGTAAPVVVVSDDPEGALQDLRAVLGPLASRLYSGGVGTTVWSDLAQLSRARALVCSNSTFCWWAARLRTEWTAMPRRWLERERARPGCAFELTIDGAELIC